MIQPRPLDRPRKRIHLSLRTCGVSPPAGHPVPRASPDVPKFPSVTPCSLALTNWRCDIGHDCPWHLTLVCVMVVICVYWYRLMTYCCTGMLREVLWIHDATALRLRAILGLGRMIKAVVYNHWCLQTGEYIILNRDFSLLTGLSWEVKSETE